MPISRLATAPDDIRGRSAGAPARRQEATADPTRDPAEQVPRDDVRGVVDPEVDALAMAAAADIAACDDGKDDVAGGSIACGASGSSGRGRWTCVLTA
jgi:hypothetical protein